MNTQKPNEVKRSRDVFQSREGRINVKSMLTTNTLVEDEDDSAYLSPGKNPLYKRMSSGSRRFPGRSGRDSPADTGDVGGAGPVPGLGRRLAEEDERSKCLAFWSLLELDIYVCVYTHTHTHTHICIYLYVL